MRKKIICRILVIILTVVTISGLKSVHAISEAQNRILNETIDSQQYDEQNPRQGLLGYFFRKDNFSDLITFAQTSKQNLFYNAKAANTILDIADQNYKSIRWVGYISSEKTDNFTLSFFDDSRAIIEVNNHIVSHLGNDKQKVHMEKGELYSIKIEYRTNESLNYDAKLFSKFQLFKTDDNNQKTQVTSNDLKTPNFNSDRINHNVSLFKNIPNFYDDPLKDTDGDSIPDDWETNGYTIQSKVAVKWTEDLGNKHYTKFLSNPFERHTVGDPYTDYEKAARDLDKSNAKETFNPLVAAFPIINVSLEKTILSPNKDLSDSVGSNSSNNWSYTNTESAKIESGIGSNGISFGVSADYSHAETVGTEWGTSKDDTTHLNTAEAAYLNANVRYNNVGTGSIYNVKPVTSFILDNATIGTIAAGQNTTALSISPQSSYPKNDQHGIAINTMDDFNSRPISLNNKQLTSYLNNSPLLLESNQVDGQYMTINEMGELVEGGPWNGVMEQINAQTASIIINSGEKVSEKKIAAKDYENPEDLTPSLTLKEGLLIAYPDEITVKGNFLYYENMRIDESSTMIYMDEPTEREVKKQINDKEGPFGSVEHLYDVKLTPKMNFTILLPKFHDAAEIERNNGMGLDYWQNAELSKTNPHTGEKSWISEDTTSLGYLTKNLTSELGPGTYHMSLYMRADSNTSSQIKVKGLSGVTLASSKVDLTTQYKKVDIPFKVVKDNISSIEISNSNQSVLYWDDISIFKINENGIPDDIEIADMHKNNISFSYSKNIVNPKIVYLDAVNFGNLQTISSLLDSYIINVKELGTPHQNEYEIPAQLSGKDGHIALEILGGELKLPIVISDRDYTIDIKIKTNKKRVFNLMTIEFTNGKPNIN